jgi:hypothetical protein
VTIDWSAIVSGALGGGAVTALLTTLIRTRHERNLQLRSAKVDAILDYIRDHLNARAALSDLRQAISTEADTTSSGDEPRRKPPAGDEDFDAERDSATKPDEPTPASERRARIERLANVVHQQVRGCRVAAARMYLMLPPKSGIRPLVDHIIRGLYDAEQALVDVERLKSANAPKANVDAQWVTFEQLDENRRTNEATLLRTVHASLWPSVFRPGPQETADEILSADIAAGSADADALYYGSR